MSAQKTTYGAENSFFARNLPFPADYAKRRELTNHLGNVLAVVSDRKIAVEDQGNPGTVEYYEADVVSAQDYYPFGMIMPGRSVSAGEYRYGFNSMEQDDEWSVTGGHLDFGARIYDSRVGRFLSIDPRWKEFTYWSPYLFASNKPIKFIDENGEGPIDPTTWSRKSTILMFNTSNTIIVRLYDQSEAPTAYDRTMYWYSGFLNLTEGGAYRELGEEFSKSRPRHKIAEGSEFYNREGKKTSNIEYRDMPGSGANLLKAAAIEGNYDYKTEHNSSEFDVVSVEDGIINKVVNYQENEDGAFERITTTTYDIEYYEEEDTGKKKISVTETTIDHQNDSKKTTEEYVHELD